MMLICVETFGKVFVGLRRDVVISGRHSGRVFEGYSSGIRGYSDDFKGIRQLGHVFGYSSYCIWSTWGSAQVPLL